MYVVIFAMFIKDYIEKERREKRKDDHIRKMRKQLERMSDEKIVQCPGCGAMQLEYDDAEPQHMPWCSGQTTDGGDE